PSTATSAPSRARRRQIARPMPEAPPVTTAFRPLSLMPGAFSRPRLAASNRAKRRRMHLAYTPEQKALGEELRAYFARLVTPEYQAELAATEGGGPLYLQTVRRLGADGWLGIGCPRDPIPRRPSTRASACSSSPPARRATRSRPSARWATCAPTPPTTRTCACRRRTWSDRRTAAGGSSRRS